ncbi:alpha/beta fold hydrolase [Actinoplanes sp. NPDC000266]
MNHNLSSGGENMLVNGVSLFVRRFGDPSRPTWDHSYLLPAVARLSDVAYVVMFDLRGCGRSSRTPELPVSALQPDHLADDVAALVRSLGAEKADVLGFSYGGMVAMRVVEQHPELVRSVILASTTAYRNWSPSADYQERRRLCPEVSFSDPVLSGPEAPDGALSRAMAVADAPLAIWHLDRLAEWHEVLDGVRFSSDWNEPYAAGKLRPAAPEDAPRVLREWGGPALVVHGARDMGFPVGVARRLHAELPGSTLAEIPEAAHMAHFDDPEAWLAAVRAFLSAQSSAS